MKKLIAIGLTVAFGFAAASVAEAAHETIDLAMEAEPSAGPLYKEVARPVNASLVVTVSNPPTEEKITPTKVANVNFPADMDFFPNEKKTPVCPASKVGPETPLASGILEIVALCPKSVVGTGTSVAQLGQLKRPLNTVNDPQLVIFNAGRNKSGRPKIAIYGFSKTLNEGLLMTGTLATNRDLKVEIGVMPFDSSVSQFRFDVPGNGIEVEDQGSPTGKTTVKGMDPAYLRGKCSTGLWSASGSFVLGPRDPGTGLPAGEESILQSNSFDLPCEGLTGKAKLKIGKVTGPKRLRAGRKGSFKLRISNPGTATGKSLKLTAKGGGKGNVKIAKLAPGATRTVRVPVRAVKRRGSVKVTFQLSGKGLKAAKVTRRLKLR